MLETRGYRVLTAVGSEKALEIFREGGIDLVLSDLIMPYMDGNELIRRMKEIAPEVPAILDELPLLGIVAAYAAGTTTVHGARELRVKESDRIAVLVQGLRALGGRSAARR